MSVEDIILLTILIFMLGIWVGASIAGCKPYSRRGLQAPIQPNVPPMPERKFIEPLEFKISEQNKKQGRIYKSQERSRKILSK